VCPSAGHSCWRQHGQEEKCLPAPGLALPVLARVSRQTAGDVSFIWTNKSWNLCRSENKQELDFCKSAGMEELGFMWISRYTEELEFIRSAGMDE